MLLIVLEVTVLQAIDEKYQAPLCRFPWTNNEAAWRSHVQRDSWYRDAGRKTKQWHKPAVNNAHCEGPAKAG
jgi:hypothetical protein